MLEKNTPFSLVLGGGGARGFAHIGLLRFLEEQNLQPTEIVGTSMGACIGAFRAYGLSSHEIAEHMKAISLTGLFDFDLSTGLIEGGKIEAFLDEIFDGKDIEQLEIPTQIIATKLVGGEPVSFTTGSITKALRASISLPGVFTPANIDGDDYIDGGLKANLPLSFANEKVCLCSSVLKKTTIPLQKEEAILGIKIPRNRISLNQEILSRSLNIMMTTQEDQMVELARSEKEIHLIRPGITDIGMFDIDKINEAVELGYTCCEKLFASN